MVNEKSSGDYRAFNTTNITTKQKLNYIKDSYYGFTTVRVRKAGNNVNLSPVIIY